MRDDIDFLEEINSKYSELENELDQKLKKLLQEEQKLEAAEAKQEKKFETPKKKCSTLEEAKKRNGDIIKSLEVAKARLRSRATYSPIEGILQRAIKAYEKETPLVPYSKNNKK